MPEKKRMWRGQDLDAIPPEERTTQDYFEPIYEENPCEACQRYKDTDEGKFPCSHCLLHPYVKEGKPYEL